jgi:hypothetical protein
VSALRLPVELAAWAELAATLVNTRPRPTDPPEKLVGLAERERLLAAASEPAPAACERDVAAVRELRPVLLAAFEANTLEALASPRAARAPSQAATSARPPCPARCACAWEGPSGSACSGPR